LIPAEDAYGEYSKDMIFRIEKDKVPSQIKPQLGQFLEIKHAGGEKGIAKIIEITDREIVLDVNHPLAGKDLHFDLQVIDID